MKKYRALFLCIFMSILILIIPTGKIFAVISDQSPKLVKYTTVKAKVLKNINEDNGGKITGMQLFYRVIIQF